MTKPYGTDPSGRPVDMIGQPIHSGRGSVPGLIIQESATMPKAEKDGVYRVGTAQFKVRKGGVIPDDAELIEQRAKDAAPENKSKQAAPENRAKKSEG